ncbi:extracellular solute-binding protein [Paenibacillus mesophilus]|uniref:ABC transporter substrate-binding protein n=1 Tax=Paenibacillus mesophilus TaxID=2582849 RepID=UPI00110D44E2|nr:extracellular solute-binding protein [Paenibacillus mesophilus]TMV49491.1 extracellular solute-binding protein [Paenibacillus mesophilus]
MVKQRIVSLGSLALSIMLVGACSSGGGGSQAIDGEKSIEAGSVETALKEPVQITIYYPWSGYPKETFMETYGNYIVKKYPNLSINYIQSGTGTTMDELIASKTELDLIMTTSNAYQSLQDRGLIGDITELAKKYKYDFNKLDPIVYELTKALEPGKMAGLPFKVNAPGLFYNKDLFDKFGVAYVKDGMTWDEVYETAKKLTREDGGMKYRGFGIRTTNFITFNQLSLPRLDAGSKAAFFTAEWKSFLENFIRFSQLPGFAPTEKGTGIGGPSLDMFVKDRTLAMLVQMNSDWPREEQGVKMNWDAVTFPEFKSRPGVGPQPEAVYFVMPSTSKKKDAAFLAMAALTDEELQFQAAKSGAAPVLKNTKWREVYGSEERNLKGRNAAALVPVKYAATNGINPYNAIAETNIAGAVNSVILGTTDMNSALRVAEEKTNKTIEEKLKAK